MAQRTEAAVCPEHCTILMPPKSWPHNSHEMRSGAHCRLLKPPRPMPAEVPTLLPPTMAL
jgi:hypothetical protein